MRIATKVFEFEAAHNLPNYNGICKQLHGHRWKLEVSVIHCSSFHNGIELDEQQMIMDFSDLKQIVNKLIINRLDHSYINGVLNSSEQPTAEVMVEWIANQLKVALPEHIELYWLKLWETSTSYIEWRP